MEPRTGLLSITVITRVRVTPEYSVCKVKLMGSSVNVLALEELMFAVEMCTGQWFTSSVCVSQCLGSVTGVCVVSGRVEGTFWKMHLECDVFSGPLWAVSYCVFSFLISTTEHIKREPYNFEKHLCLSK